MIMPARWQTSATCWPSNRGISARSSGMGFILRKTGFDKEALRVFRKTLEIYPQQDSIRKIVDDLTIEVEGRGI